MVWQLQKEGLLQEHDALAGYIMARVSRTGPENGVSFESPAWIIRDNRTQSQSTTKVTKLPMSSSFTQKDIA